MEGSVTLSPDEVAGALHDMAAVETRSRRVYGHRETSRSVDGGVGGGALILTECWFRVV
jgi:hypothetical protein